MLRGSRDRPVSYTHLNLAGLPGISVPCKTDEKGLPIGLQMIAGCFEEKKLFRAASAYEKARGRWELPISGCRPDKEGK